MSPWNIHLLVYKELQKSYERKDLELIKENSIFFWRTVSQTCLCGLEWECNL